MIEIRNVSKIYDSGNAACTALDHLTASIPEDGFTAIMGKSGSGKTTLLNILGLVDRPNQGRILVQGKDILQYRRKEILEYRRTGVGIVFQFFQLIPALNCLDNIRIANQYAPRFKREYLDYLIDEMDIRGILDKYPSEISGGEKQRIAIARALINHPKMILADEPTGNLDTQNSERVVSLLKQLTREQRITLIMVTHDLDVAEQADRIMHLSDGHLEVLMA